ncbi:amino acid adenylation domain-containing protein [Polyangium sp. 6x1]|uniref:non-ribosomal peptide synthetase n=1 Tax=Polyangium sp. 6x1 TaxID=3042689 RepID=UPI00248315BB|nr:amino acid adenylation domain-containing protein [Polyangium sp. 6x1]MDI1443020.1 amino acid adenylation domain-containing protein [Polyangium sp. 6x1]
MSSRDLLNEMAKRLASLTPAQRELFEQRARQKGLDSSRLQSIQRRPSDGTPALLSFSQERLWFLHQMSVDTTPLNLVFASHLGGTPDVSALERAFSEIVRRHEVLRTRFVLREGVPVQQIDAPLPIELHVERLEGLPGPERERETERMIQEAQRPFDLSRGPLLRAILLRWSANEHTLLFAIHHIAADGWSLGVLVRELAALYEAFATSKPSPLPELPLQFADFAAHQRGRLEGAVLERDLSHWRSRLSGAPPLLELPTDRPRPTLQGSRGGTVTFDIPEALTSALESLARREGATLFMALLAAFDVLLARYSRTEDIVVGTPVANRSRPELEPLIGCFVNALALRADLSGNPSFRALLGRVKDVALDAFAHQELPFERLVEELRPQRDPSHAPIFQVMFVLQNAPLEELSLAGLTLRPRDVTPDAVMHDLTLTVRPVGAKLHAWLEYSAELFDRCTIERMAGHLLVLLDAFARCPDEKILDAPLLTEAERRTLLVEWNDTAEYSQERGVHQAFEAWAARAPEAVAVVSETYSLRYGELNARSNQLAHGLCARGLAPRQRIAVMLGHGPAQVPALLGVLKAGAVVVPLDPAHPPERLRHVLEEVAPSLVLVDADSHAHVLSLLDRAGAQGPAAVIDVTGIEVPPGAALPEGAGFQAFVEMPEHDPEPSTTPADPMYVVYTSGSTGRPKGIVQSHRSFAQFLDWQARRFGIGPSERVAQWAPISYDAGLCELFGALCHGATLCLAPLALRTDPRAALEWVSAERITLLQMVPSFCRHLLDAARSPGAPAVPHLARVLLAGEALPVSLARDWLAFFGPRPALFNLYGPSETVLATHYAVERVDPELSTIPIGRAIDGRQILVLDEARRPCPIGIPGEVHVRSAFLTEGYLGRTEETQKAYVQNPLHDHYPDRVYRTGDLARWRPDGTLEFLGRRDHQVKIRGNRVEISEVEGVLAAHPAMRECAVIAHRASETDQRLIAFVVCAPAPSSTEIRQFVAERLPSYMVPAAFVFLDALPRTSTGKIDRKSLEVPSGERPDLDRAFVAPRSGFEETIASVWREVLGLERVGVHDNFFDVGGHSLLMVQLRDRLARACGTEIPIIELFRHPTIDALTRYLDASRAPAEEAVVEESGARARNRRSAMQQLRDRRAGHGTSTRNDKGGTNGG